MRRFAGTLLLGTFVFVGCNGNDADGAPASTLQTSSTMAAQSTTTMAPTTLPTMSTDGFVVALPVGRDDDFLDAGGAEVECYDFLEPWFAEHDYWHCHDALNYWGDFATFLGATDRDELRPDLPGFVMPDGRLPDLHDS